MEDKKTLDKWTPPKETFAFRIISKMLTFATCSSTWVIMYLFNNTKFYGTNILKKEKAPYIFASNHTSIFDSGFLDVAFLIKAMGDYTYQPYHTPEYGNFYKNKLMSWYMDRVKCLPIERGKGIDQFAQKLVTQKLLEGNVVHIFPEGTRSRSGELLPGKAGIGKRIYESKVKVIPCYHYGMRELLPVGKKMPGFGNKIRVIIGEPIFFDEFFNMANVPDTWKQISQKVMDEIKKLKGELHEREKR